MASYTVQKGDSLWAIWRDRGPKEAGISFTDWRNEVGYANTTLIHPGDELAWAPSTADEAGDEAGDETPEGARINIPGGAEVWIDNMTGEVWLVYQVPGTDDDPIYMRWSVPDEDTLQSFFGPDQEIIYDRELDDMDPIWDDALDFGSSDDLANFDDHPFASWETTMAVESQSQPWILDDDYQQLLAMAVLENRTLTDAELQSTNWWQTHNEAERAWLHLFHADPAEAEERTEQNRAITEQLMRDLGISNANPELINFISDQVTMGHWDAEEARLQIRILSDPYFAGYPLNEELAAFVSDNGITVDQTQGEEDRVRNAVSQWLGSNFGNWDDSLVSQWAGRLRNEGDAYENLLETLKDQRLALFPGYDREASYATIAAPWKSFIANRWGEQMDDSDPFLHNIINLNDATEAGKRLTTEGLARGNQQTSNMVQTALMNSFGGSAR